MTPEIDSKGFIEKVKISITNQIDDLVNNKKNILDGFQFCKAHAEIYDDAIKKIFLELFPDSHISIAACGSYGRNELCYKSDIDIVFLTGNAGSDETNNRIRSILKSFWDLGLELGYSIRSNEDCINTYYNDHSSFTALLETRYICGDPFIYINFINKFYDFLEDEKNFFFIHSVVEGIDLRHTKFGNSVKLLEPNVKNSAGSLRDLHDLFWIFKSFYPHSYTNIFAEKKYEKKRLINELKIQGSQNSILVFLENLNKKNIINFMLYRQVVDAYNFLLKVRNELHFHESLHSDLLKYNIQKIIASNLGYKGHEGLNVRNFMRDYYLNARKIFRLNTIIREQFAELLTARKSRAGRKKILDDDFIINNNNLSFRNEEVNIFIPDTSKIFKVFYYKSKYGVRLDEEIRNAIVNSLEYFNENLQKDRTAAEYFIKILKSKSHVELTLNSMNELGVLGRFIPEFGKFIAIYQYSRYHYYTADEHTLIAIKNLEAIESKGGLLKDVLDKIQKREVLNLAILFHDIGKIYQFKEHENIGAEIVERIFNRLGMEKYLEIVKFLVKNHLLMEQVAFRRNCSDMQTVLDFALRVGNIHRLNYLYLLTYADLSAVNPGVWTDWKGALLNELYIRTKDVFESKEKKISFKELNEKSIKSKLQKVIKKLTGLVNESVINSHIDNFNETGYLYSFSEDSIIEHVKALQCRKEISVLMNHHENYSDVTVITNDAIQILSKICGVLTANDANIIDAKIFTGKNNLVIDSFRVTNIISAARLEEDQALKITSDFYSVLSDKMLPEELFDSHKRKWQRKIQHRREIKIKPHIEFEFDNKYSIIDIFSADCIGFLYKITHTLSELNLNIFFAKIATYGDGIVDSFYVLNGNNEKIKKEVEEEIRNKLLLVIDELLDSELISN
jgi:[protein-PII] uridylyltransferase